MKVVIILFLASISLVSSAQVINTIAGNGILGNSGNGGISTSAELNYPFTCVFDSHGDFYFTEVGGNKVRKINKLGIISTIAGGGSSLGDGGPATSAQFADPTGIAIDKENNIYIVDLYESRLRKIDAISGIITTIAGNGTSGYAGDNGPATGSMIDANNVCFDKLGNMYITDLFRIRKINTSGIISTYAGTGVNGYTGDGGIATSAQVAPSIGICADTDNNIYFGQGNYIRKISNAGIITTIAGNGAIYPSGDGGPATAAGVNPYELIFDRYGNLYISCYILNIVRKIDNAGIIYTVAGNGVGGYSGDGGQATAAELYTPIGITTDTCGNLFIVDRDDNHIRKVEFNSTCRNLSAENIVNKTDLNISPNPAYNNLNIDNLKTPSTYQLTNLIGRTTQQGTLKKGNNTISLQYLLPGMYLLELIGEDGERVVRKVVKE